MKTLIEFSSIPTITFPSNGWNFLFLFVAEKFRISHPTRIVSSDNTKLPIGPNLTLNS
jgi:hypothetical protein